MLMSQEQYQEDLWIKNPGKSCLELQEYLVFVLHFALLSFAYIVFFLNKLKVCGNPVSIKSVGAIFPTAFAHFTSMCHILAILAIFQTFSLLLYL